MAWTWLAMLLFAGSPSGATDAVPAKPALMRAGWLADADYPKDARQSGEEGTVAMRYRVGTDGKVAECEVVSSSNSASLDRKSCEVVTKRFRFSAARDGSGAKMPQTIEQSIAWRLSTPCPVLGATDICVKPDIR